MKTKLHIGCGGRDLGKDWEQIDGGIYPHAKQIMDLGHLPYEDNTFELIYASHVIEYFDRDEVVKVLTEWKRVLKQGGILRLSVPDFGQLTQLYLNKNVSLDRLLGPIFGKMSMGEQIIYHKTIYDFESLYRLLIKLGFKKPHTWEIYDVEHQNIDDHSQARMPTNDHKITLISLNIQCTK